MLKNWKLYITSAALAGAAITAGCFNFDEDLENCQRDGRCTGNNGECVPVALEEVPDDLRDFNCDGFDGVAANALFVDPEKGSDEVGVPGTPGQPLKSLTEALARIKSGTASGITAVYLARGTFAEEGLELDVPVSVHGGYGGLNDWFRRPGYVTTLSGGTVGLTVRGLGDAGVELEQLTIRSADGVDAGEPSIALSVFDTTGLRLRHGHLTAGLGARGAEGAQGGQGSNGLDGGDGQGATDGAVARFGPGGTSNCESDKDSSGGNGGMGVNGTEGKPGAEGKPGIDGGTFIPGGDGGTKGEFEKVGSSSSFWYCEAGNGDPGINGTEGDAGQAGLGGEGMGVVQDGRWVANQTGQPGKPGEPGAGGGGGGSGGSCDSSEALVANSGAGGGGGSGGCGGQGGEGGGGGGASIALYLINSHVEMEGLTLQTAGGGEGGRGGPGGPGGMGGPGGTGGGNFTLTDFPSDAGRYESVSGRGGNGGNGGDGGTGGPGGGGGGGPSVGVWCGPNSSYVSDTELAEDELGPGGNGGQSPGGHPGVPGERHLDYDCPSAAGP